MIQICFSVDVFDSLFFDYLWWRLYINLYCYEMFVHRSICNTPTILIYLNSNISWLVSINEDVKTAAPGAWFTRDYRIQTFLHTKVNNSARARTMVVHGPTWGSNCHFSSNKIDLARLAHLIIPKWVCLFEHWKCDQERIPLFLSY